MYSPNIHLVIKSENSRDSLWNPLVSASEVDSDWSKAHVIHNGLFDWIITTILFQSVIGVMEGL